MHSLNLLHKGADNFLSSSSSVSFVDQAGAMADIEQVLLQQLADKGSIADTGVFAAELKEDHLKVVGVIKSLEMAEMITVQVGATLIRTATACGVSSRFSSCRHCWRGSGAREGSVGRQS